MLREYLQHKEVKMNKKDFIKALKNDFYNDYLILVDSVVFGFKYWVYGNKEIAQEQYNKIKNNCDLLKPCTVELINLWG